MSATLEKVVTSGTFSLDGGTWDVDNNVWILGDDDECVVIDAAHDASAIRDAIGSRTLKAILLTHAHDDHVSALAELRTAYPQAAVALHPADKPLWDLSFPDAEPTEALSDGQRIEIARTELQVLHTPGHAPGACCFYAPDLGAVFTGDTLFNGGPGATGRSFSDYPTIVQSIESRLFSLPAETVVHTGHGDDTTIGAETPLPPND